MIKSVKFKRFKSFKAEQTLELRPITVIIGKNNSGKSAVLGLVDRLQSSINDDRFKPVFFENKPPLVFHGSETFNDLVHNKNTSISLDIDLSFENEDSLKTQLMETSNGNILFESYDYNGTKWLADIDTGEYKNNDNSLPTLSKCEKVYHGALRPEIRRFYTNKNYIAGYKLSNAALNEKVSNWYIKNMGIDIVYSKAPKKGVLFSLCTNIEKETNFKKTINLADTGAGIGQSLPIVIETLENKDNTLHIIEQPELHLHPAAHANMAQLLADAVNENNTVKFLVETHSENFILRLRTLCAEGKLLPSQIKLYFIEKEGVESNLKTIEIDEMGEVNWWPENVFSEAADEVMALRMAQFAKNK